MDRSVRRAIAEKVRRGDFERLAREFVSIGWKGAVPLLIEADRSCPGHRRPALLLSIGSLGGKRARRHLLAEYELHRGDSLDGVLLRALDVCEPRTDDGHCFFRKEFLDPRVSSEGRVVALESLIERVCKSGSSPNDRLVALEAIRGALPLDSEELVCAVLAGLDELETRSGDAPIVVEAVRAMRTAAVPVTGTLLPRHELSKAG